MKRKITIFVWILWFIHLFANIEAWMQYRKLGKKIQWLPK